MSLFYALLSAISAALVSIFAKIGLKNIDSTLATTIRALIMALFLLSTSIIFKKINSHQISQLNNKDWIFIILSGIAGATSWLFYFMALKNGNTSKIAAVDKSSILFISIFALIFLGETLKIKNIFGLILIFIGTLFMVL